jgi:hypothetical protein
MTSSLNLFAVVATLLVLSPTAAHARVRCGAYTTHEYRAEVDPATAIFVGELIASQPREDLPEDTGGVRGVDLRFRVTQAIRGVAVGDEVTVYWRGFQEPENARVGGCRVPEAGDGLTSRFLVIAQGPMDALSVSNRTTSKRVAGDSRLVQRVRRMARSR